MDSYDIFISYRRSGGEYLSHNLYERLKSLGYSVFQDVESLRQGKFNDALYNVIEQCKDFILVLPPNGLDRCFNEDDWVRKEIAKAIESHKNIIPVFMPGFEFPLAESLPADISDIVNYNGIIAQTDYFDAFIEKLDDFLFSSPVVPAKEKKPLNHKKKKLIAAMLILALIVSVTVGIVFGVSNAPKSSTSSSVMKIDTDFDSHIVMELENANHQYEVGLINWKRLELNKAETNIVKALEETQKSFSDATIDVAKINNSLGCLYIDMGRYEEAYNCLNSAYVTFRDEYGEGTAKVNAILFSIAEYYYYIGDIDTAKKTIQQIVDTSDTQKDKVIITVAESFRAMIDTSLGNYETALESYETVLSLYGEYLENGKLNTVLSDYTTDSSLLLSEKEQYTNTVEIIASVYGKIGGIYVSLADYNKADESVQTGLDLCLNNIYIGTKSLITANLYLVSAKIEYMKNNIDKAIDCVDLAMRIEKNIFDFEGVYPGLVDVYCTYGTVLSAKENLEEPKSFYDDALELALSSFGENHPKTAAVYNFIGLYFVSIKEYDFAADYFSNAITIQKNILSKNHPNTVNYYLNFADALIKIGDYELAKASIAEAENICTQLNIMQNYNKQIIVLKGKAKQ